MLRSAALPIAQAAVAAAIAWVAATHLIGHPRPFFAPISSVVALSLAGGLRRRRAVELVAGVSIGIFVGDIIVHELGSGWLTIALGVALAMSATILLGGGQLVIAQAANSSILVATLVPPEGSLFDPSRAIDAAVGCTIGVLVHALVLPINPLTTAARAVQPIIDEMAAVLDDVAAALRDRDREAMVTALLRARGLDDLYRDFHGQLQLAAETARVAPPRFRARGPIAIYETADPHIDLALRNVRVLARGALRPIELEDAIPPEVPVAIEELAQAVRRFGVALHDEGAEDDARAAALHAAGLATLALEQTGNLSISVIVGQVRSTATDLLRGLGMSAAEARSAVRAAASELAG